MNTHGSSAMAVHHTNAIGAMPFLPRPDLDLLDALPIIVWTSDARTFRFKYVSGGAERLLGYPAEQWIENPNFWRDHIHPDDRNVIALCHSETQACRDHTLLYRMIAAEGHAVWIRDTVQIRSEHGVAVELYGMMFDVTSEIEAHRALAQSEENYRRMVHFSPDAIGVHRDGSYIYVNPSFTHLLGARDASELLGRHVLSLIHPDYVESVRERLGLVARGESVPLLHERLIRDDGATIDVEVTALPITFNGAPAVQVVFRDISERVRAAECYRQLVEGVSDVIYTLDSEGHITSLNGAFETLSGLKIDDWIGRSFLELLLPDSVERAAANFYVAVHGLTNVHGSYRMRAANGAVRDIETSGHQRVAGDPTQGIIGMARDVTERNAMTHRLEEAKRLASLGDLAATMAHEMNNVLMAIQPYCELLIRRTGENEFAAAARRTIDATIGRGKRITGEILTYTNPKKAEPQRIAPTAWMADVQALIEPLLPKNVTLRVRTRLREAIVGDQQHLEQVVANLVANAVYAMPDGGVLTLDLEEDTDHFARLTVRDTGAGIPADILPQIFEPLFTTKRGGTGLGLAIAKRLVEAQGGTITVESTATEGTAFHVFLPLG